jgi:hypothetical protein
MSPSAIFVLSDMRSGSTLLDQLLGAHSNIISLGEVHWLTAYALEDRTIYDPVYELVCTCGQSVPRCGFWTKVALSLGRPLESLHLRPTFAANRFGRAPIRLVYRYPALFRFRLMQRMFDGPQVARDSIELFDAVRAVSGRSLVVDSSKSPFRFRAVHDAQPGMTCAILLARDYRAVVHSKMKRGYSLEAAAIGWRNRMTQIEALTEDLPPGRMVRLRYEDLCEDPEKELARICRFLQLEFSPAMLTRPTDNIHHIGGSPSKFDPARVAISMDTAYRQAFEPATLARLRALVGDVAGKWAY